MIVAAFCFPVDSFDGVEINAHDGLGNCPAFSAASFVLGIWVIVSGYGATSKDALYCWKESVEGQ